MKVPNTESVSMQITKAVPTNIITGFLGVGKTTAILHLLASKPTDERWAVLVNEFGEIGIDGGLIAGSHGSQSGVFIREVAGGCMCCDSGLPMQIALNRLLMDAKPDRLLIEPTGLGHPQGVIESLSQPHYATVIDLRATLTLVDPRRIRDPRYTQNAIFSQQIAVADVLIANKSDQCLGEDFVALDDYLAKKAGHEKPLYRVSFGKIPLTALSAASAFAAPNTNPWRRFTMPAFSKTAVGLPESPASLDRGPLPEGDYIKIENRADGFTSIGWRFHASILFDRVQLHELLSGLAIQRVKAIFITSDGVFGYNLSDQMLTEVELDKSQESCIEGIDDEETGFENLEADLLSCFK